MDGGQRQKCDQLILDLSGAVLDRKIVASQTFDKYTPIEEDHDDELVITEHPIDKGAVMSDHIYLRPPTVKLLLGWSNADLAASGPTYARDTYSDLLKMKNDRGKLAKVYTGKRLYNNMFVLSMQVHTDAPHEYALLATVTFKQLLLVQTASPTTASPTTAAPSATPGAQKAPAKTTPTTSTGTNYTTPADYEIGPSGVASSPTTGFTSLQTGNGDTQIPSGATGLPTGAPEGTFGMPNSTGGGAGPLDVAVPFGM